MKYEIVLRALHISLSCVSIALPARETGMITIKMCTIYDRKVDAFCWMKFCTFHMQIIHFSLLERQLNKQFRVQMSQLSMTLSSITTNIRFSSRAAKQNMRNLSYSVQNLPIILISRVLESHKEVRTEDPVVEHFLGSMVNLRRKKYLMRKQIIHQKIIQRR